MLDWVKSFVISLVIPVAHDSGRALAGAGEPCTVVVLDMAFPARFSLFVMYIAPYVIEPLFNTIRADQ